VTISFAKSLRAPLAAYAFDDAVAVLRAVGELFREPDASLVLGLSRGTFYSLFVVIAGVWLIVRARRR